MAKPLQEYVEWLDGRDDLIWPKLPPPQPAKAKPFLKPLEGILAVVWNVYGTLLRVADGQLLFLHKQPLRMQVALEKTIKEFNMWNSMSRKPGAPWEYLYQQYKRLVEDQELAGTQQKGQFPQVNSVRIWRKLLDRLEQNEYQYDEDFYGDMDELSEKVAYFFHANLQGVEAAPNALSVLVEVSQLPRTQGLLADAQTFTMAQMLRALKEQGTLPPLGGLFKASCLTFSYQEGVRKPSPSLFSSCLRSLESLDISPRETLYVSSRIRDDLAIARQAGMRTALYAGDKASLQATSSDLNDPDRKPDRLITDLEQIRNILAIG